MHSERNVVKRVSGARSVPAIVDPETGVTMSEARTSWSTWSPPTPREVPEMVDFDVVSLPETDHVAEGDAAPDFHPTRSSARSTGRTARSARPSTGRRSCCSTRWTAPFRRRISTTRSTTTAGPTTWTSSASRSRHRTPTSACSPSAPTASGSSDPGADVIDAYGLAHDIDGMTGIAETRPAVFLLDADRTVEYAWVASEHPEFPRRRGHRRRDRSARRLIRSGTPGCPHAIPHTSLFRDRHERIPVTKDTDTLRRAAEAVADGDLVVYPTETVYGLGGDALDPTAVERVFDLKGRERSTRSRSASRASTPRSATRSPPSSRSRSPGRSSPAQ